MSNDRRNKKPIDPRRHQVNRAHARDPISPAPARRHHNGRFFRDRNDLPDPSEPNQIQKPSRDVYEEFWRDAIVAFILICLIIAVGPSRRYSRSYFYSSPVRTLLRFR